MGIEVLWVGWMVVWLAASFTVKPTERREQAVSRVLTSAPLVICAALFVLPSLPSAHVVRWAPWMLSVGTLLVAAGLGFAIWARVHLGGNWSGSVELKADHALVRSGPYRLVRHPIYTGMLLALLGSALALDEWRGVLGLAFGAAGIARRVWLEDRWMAAAFGAEHAAWRRETAAVIPFLL